MSVGKGRADQLARAASLMEQSDTTGTCRPPSILADARSAPGLRPARM